ncbi:MAG: hypothetical protein IT410_01085 [Candidatus Doudnabacteria bacterium]|nr:hypothetical protein [Candidatus Doudnabacteria bacterium]
MTITKIKKFSKSFPPSGGPHHKDKPEYGKTFDLLHAAAVAWAEQNGLWIPKLDWCDHELKGLSTYYLYVKVPKNFEGDLSEVKLEETTRK